MPRLCSLAFLLAPPDGTQLRLAQETESTLGNGSMRMSRLSLRNVTEGLLILGTALTIYWQPLAKRIPLKASDVVFVLALCAWMLFLLRDRQTPIPDAPKRRLILPLFVLLGSLLVATLVGYLRYDLTMSRDGLILLVRLVVCTALFVAIYHFSRIDVTFGQRVSLAFLSPIVLFPAMSVPALSGRMWEADARFQGFTVNPNTAALAFCISLALAYVLAIYEMNAKRPLRACFFAIVAVGMLALILWTQSRAYFAGAFGSLLLGTILAASKFKLLKPGIVASATLAVLLVVAATLLLAPRSLINSYVSRISGHFGQRTSTPLPSGRQALAQSNWVLIRGQPSFAPGRYGTLDDLERLPSGGVRRLMENPHVQAAVLYLQLLPTNYLGLGVNYDEKFFLYFPWIDKKHQGPNSILDIPVYGGVGAVLTVGYLMLLVARKAQDRLHQAPDETLPYAMGAAAAFGGLWIAAILLGSPIFDYQFWIVTAIALM
jgi:hypothetical protein